MFAEPFLISWYWQQLHSNWFIYIYQKINDFHIHINSLRPRQNGGLFADDTFKCIFLNENIRISTNNSLKFVPKGLINNIPALVQIMACRRPGDKPLSGPMMVRLPTHICVTRPQWINKQPTYNWAMGITEAETKWTPFRRWHFQVHFLEW